MAKKTVLLGKNSDGTRRVFMGLLDASGLPGTKRTLHQKALKAYLQGKERFAHGKDDRTGFPLYWDVPQTRVAV